METMPLTNTLIALRKAHGFSQEKLAEQLGVSRQTISRWEVGEFSPSMKNLKVLSDLYQVPVEVFFQETAPVQEAAPERPPVPLERPVSQFARQFRKEHLWTLAMLFCLLGMVKELFSNDQHPLLDDALFWAGLGSLLLRTRWSPRELPRKHARIASMVLILLIGWMCCIVWYGFGSAASFPHTILYARMEYAVLYSLGSIAVLAGIAGIVQEVRSPSTARANGNGRVLYVLSLTLLASILWILSLFHDITRSHAPSACWLPDLGKECAYAVLGAGVIRMIVSGNPLANSGKS